MIRTILVPLDGSLLAERAIPPACRAAREAGATLVLVRAVHVAHGQGGDERTHEVAPIGEAGRYLQAVRTRLEESGLRARAQVLPGPAASAILFAAHAAGADLISMATHGSAGIRRALLGSVTEEVIRRTDLPVLLARAVAGGDETGPYATILVGLDGTPAAEAAVDYLTGAGFGRSARTVLLQAVAPAPLDLLPAMAAGEVDHRLYAQAAQATEARRLAAQDYLQSFAEVRLRGRTWQARVALDDPAHALMEAARLEHADLIVVATHDHRGVERLLSGGVARSLLQRAEVPLLLLRGRSLAAMVTVDHGTEDRAAPDEAAGEPIALGQAGHRLAGSARRG